MIPPYLPAHRRPCVPPLAPSAAQRFMGTPLAASAAAAVMEAAPALAGAGGYGTVIVCPGGNYESLCVEAEHLPLSPRISPYLPVSRDVEAEDGVWSSNLRSRGRVLRCARPSPAVRTVLVARVCSRGALNTLHNTVLPALRLAYSPRRLPISPHISPYLPISPHISPYLPP